MRIIFRLFMVVLVAALGFVAWVFFTLDPEELGRQVLGMVSESTGLQLTAASFEIRPLQGVDLENGKIEGELESGTLSGTLDRMVVDYELVPILKREVVIRQILLERPDLELVSRPAGDGPPAEFSDGGLGEADDPGFISAVSISEIRVLDGNLRVTTEGTDPVAMSLEGLDFELRDIALDATAATTFLGLAAQGGIHIDRIALKDKAILGGRGQLVVDHGRLAVTDLGIETEHASLEIAEIAADATENPVPYRMQVGGSYDLNGLVEAEGDGFGPASLEFAAQGSGPNLNDMRAEGMFRLESGRIPAFPMMVKIEELLGRSILVGFPYEGADIVFSITEGNAVFEPFVMGFENLQMAGAGSIDLDGPIEIQIDIRLPRESVSNSILDPFVDGLTDEEGWTTIPFNIGGTMAEPVVDFDMTSIRKTAGELGKRAVSRALDSAVTDLKEKTLSRRQNRDDG